MSRPQLKSETSVPRRRQPRAGVTRIAYVGSWVAVLSLIGLGLLRYGSWFKKSEPAALTYQVSRRNLQDTIIERGTLESQSTVQGICDLPGWQNKIISIVPEGSAVETGALVVEFDSSEIDKLIAANKSKLVAAEGKLESAKQELAVQKNKGESDIAAAELELQLADLDLTKYRDGDYIAERADMERSISEGDAELKKVSDELVNMRALVRKGFRSPEQLRELELRVKTAQFRVDRDQQKYNVLLKFDHQRKITEFSAKAGEAKRKRDRAKATAEAEIRKAQANLLSAESDLALVQTELRELDRYKANCRLTAPKAGTIAYANNEWMGPEERIREGATVRQQQTVFYLPDMSRMQVKVNVHESVVNKVKKGLETNLQIEAFSGSSLKGTIQQVSELASSSRSDSKSYEVTVMIESFPPELKLKPGMTARVEIVAGNYDNLLAVPVGALTEKDGRAFTFVSADKAILPREVKLGRTTHSFVEIVEGLKEGELVLLDAYVRGLTELEDRSPGIEESLAEPLGNADDEQLISTSNG
jgi:RND family efflux transporter MFP subunit